ncbi:MAG: antibiotic biosynthesis monooxygenase [Chloroflexi bacterium]|nr:antibiotic biosynthesis monooxygenase [Chloroflexota bacterium]
MILEVVEMTIDGEQREEFVKVYKDAWREANLEGSHKGKVMRCIEDPNKVVVLIEWDDVAAHRQHRQTPRQNTFRSKIDPYMKHWEVQHFQFEELTD